MTTPSPFLKHITSQGEITTLVREKPAVLIDFFATWCGPCSAIAPFFSQLADRFKTVTFAKVDVDKLQAVAKKYNVTAMPTFVLIKGGEEVGRIKGANPKALEDLVTKHAPKADASTAGASGSGDFASASDVSLLEYLDTSQVNCLNENQDHTLKSIVGNKRRNTTDAYLESDADEQLLITLAFIQVVRIRSIIIHTKDASKGPKGIKIDINKPSLGFDDIENAKEPAVVQELEVPKDLIEQGKHIHLRFVRLQRVNTLHIFVSSNHGAEDETRIDAIDVFGQPVATTQVSGLKKVDDE